MDDLDKVEADEILYRRIEEKTGHFNPSEGLPPSLYAFRPNEKDTTGLSMGRAKFYDSPEQFAHNGKSGQVYCVLLVKVSNLRDCKLNVVAAPRADDPGHCELSAINWPQYAKDKTSKRATQALMQQVANFCFDYKGPFPVP